MKLLYFSPRAFGMMGTPGTYQLTEAFSSLVDTLVVSAKYNTTNVDIVHKPQEKLNLKTIDITTKNHLEEFEKILVSFNPNVVCIANYAKWYDVAQIVKTTFPNSKIILDIKSPLITGTTDQLQTLNNVQLQSQKYQNLLDLAVSRCQEDIQSWIPHFKGKTLLYPLGLDLELFTPKKTLNLREETLKIVFVGSYSKNRKLDKLLEVISKLEKNIKEKISLDMYGSGTEKDRLQQYIYDLQLENIVTLYDALQQQKLFSLLPNYDVGLGWVPKEIYDAAPSLKSLEYIASGIIPLLTSTKGHVREVTDGFNAILFDETAKSLELALKKILNNSFTTEELQENLERIKERNWKNIAQNILLSSFEKLSSLDLPKHKEDTDKVQNESHWNFPCKAFQSNKEQTYDISVGCITGERLYYGLKDEFNYVVLTEDTWEKKIETKKLAFLLIETCYESVVGTWSYSLVHNVSEELKSMINYAKSHIIPVIIWSTVDIEYKEHFKKLFLLADYVAYADTKYKTFLDTLNVNSFELFPAIQPRLFNPLKVLDEYSQYVPQIDILLQSANQVENDDHIVETIKQYSSIQFTGFERTLVPTRNHIYTQNTLAKNFSSNGKISYRMLPEVLKRANTIVFNQSNEITQIELLWQFLENAACRCMSFFGNEVVLEHPLFKSVVPKCPLVSDEPIKEAVNASNNLLKTQSEFIPVWREIMDKHTYKDRLETIFRHIKIDSVSINKHFTTIVTPTKRVRNIESILRNFNAQKFQDKELIIVVNSSEEDFLNLSNHIQNLENVRAVKLPVDKKAASALNIAADLANGDYIFRFDDDDYYGEKYLSDVFRFLTIDDASIIGKFGSYIKIEDRDEVYFRKNSSKEKELQSFESKNLPLKEAGISGATFGIKIELVKLCPFPEDSLRTADSAWLEKVRSNYEHTRCLKTDFFQFTIGRTLGNNDHTWSGEVENLVNLSHSIDETIEEIVR